MKVIAVDFDGTLCESKWPNIGDPHWPVIHELIRRQADGDRIILWTCRQGALLEEAVLWCLNHGIKFNAINSNIPERITLFGNDPRKISADEYWDDRAVLVCGGKGLLRADATGSCIVVQEPKGTSPSGFIAQAAARIRILLSGLRRLITKQA